MAPWRTSIGLALLAAAAAVHYANALWSIWLRRSLSLSRWEWWQLALGLCIPALLVHHVVSVRIAIGVAGFEGTYEFRARAAVAGAALARRCFRPRPSSWCGRTR